MAENKWIIDGHHYTCPECGNIMAIVENESDEGFDFCPFCGKRMSGQLVEDRLKVTHLLGKKLDEPIIITENKNKMEQIAAMFGKKLGEEFQIKGKICDFCFTEYGLEEYGCVGNEHMLVSLLTGRAEIVEDKK